MRKRLAGVLPIAHTPFTTDDRIDWESLERQIDWAFDRGADGFCTGMVSEVLRLTAGERIELMQRHVAMARGRGPVVASVGAESVRQAVEYARAAADAGCDAMMAIPPISTALPADEVHAYYAALARAVDLTLIVQDASGYVGKAIPLSVYAQLVDEFGPERVVFKPEAAPIGPNLSALRDATGGKLASSKAPAAFC